MKKRIGLWLLVLTMLLAGCKNAERSGVEPPTVPPETAAPAVETRETEQTEPVEQTQPTVQETQPDVYSFTEEEEQLLLKIGMAERGNAGCTDCIALVMRTVLNRVEAGGFGRSIEGVILAQDQFTPVADGSYYRAQPNEYCLEALEMVVSGWDESQGALYYEFCVGESWHSKNLQLLFQHCNTRFYK